MKIRTRTSIFASFLLITLLALPAHAQSNSEATDIEEIVEVIIKLRDAAESNDSTAVKEQSKILKRIQIDDEVDSSDEYFDSRMPAHDNFSIVWEEALRESKDSIAQGDNPDLLGRTDPSGSLRGSETVTTKRYRLKKGESIKHITRGSDKLSVAAIPQAGGLITMRIHAHNRHGCDEHFDDNEKFHQGMNYRKRQIKLPDSPTKVDIEILNRTKQDITFLLVTK